MLGPNFAVGETQDFGRRKRTRGESELTRREDWDSEGLRPDLLSSRWSNPGGREAIVLPKLVEELAGRVAVVDVAVMADQEWMKSEAVVEVVESLLNEPQAAEEVEEGL